MSERKIDLPANMSTSLYGFVRAFLSNIVNICVWDTYKFSTTTETAFPFLRSYEILIDLFILFYTLRTLSMRCTRNFNELLH